MLGVLGSVAVSRVVRGLLFGVGVSDPLSYAAAVVLLTGAAVAACYLPARRATRVHPLVALRHE